MLNESFIFKCLFILGFCLAVKPNHTLINLAAALLWHQITIRVSHEKKPKRIFYSTGKGSLGTVSSQQQLHPRPSAEHVEATWGLFYHLAAQTHTWHTCQRGLSQGTDPIGVVGLPLETRQNGSSVLHGQLKREGGGGREDEDKIESVWQEENKNRWGREMQKKSRWREQMIEDSENSLREVEEEERGCNRGNKKGGLII